MDKIYDQLATKYHQFHDDTDRSCLAAAANGRLDILKQLKESGTSPREEAIYLAALHGHLPILEWHAEVNSNGRQPYCKYAYAILLAVAQSGNTEIRRKSKVIYSNTAIDRAAYNGHLNVLKWFAASGLEFKYVHAINYAIVQGHLDILKWFKASGYKFRYVCSRIRWDQVAPEIKNWMTENNIAINTSDHD